MDEPAIFEEEVRSTPNCVGTLEIADNGKVTATKECQTNSDLLAENVDGLVHDAAAVLMMLTKQERFRRVSVSSKGTELVATLSHGKRLYVMKLRRSDN